MPAWVQLHLHMWQSDTRSDRERERTGGSSPSSCSSECIISMRRCWGCCQENCGYGLGSCCSCSCHPYSEPLGRLALPPRVSGGQVAMATTWDTKSDSCPQKKSGVHERSPAPVITPSSLCKKHPRYKAKRKPITACELCWMTWFGRVK